MGGRNLFCPNLVNYRRDKSRLIAHRLYQVVEECGDGGFTVCACNSHHLQLVRRVTVKVRGDSAHREVCILNHYKCAIGIGDFGRYVLAYHRNGSALYRLGDKVMPIDSRTRNGKETAAFGNGA